MARRVLRPRLAAVALAALALGLALCPDSGFAQPSPDGRLPPPRRGGFLEMLFGPSLLQPFRPFQNAPPPPANLPPPPQRAL